MTRTMSREVEYVDQARDRLGITYKQIARMIGADESTVHRWRMGDTEPSPVFVRQLEELGALLDELARTFADPDAARAWLEQSVPLLRNRRPIDLLRSGRIGPVVDALFALNAGIGI